MLGDYMIGADYGETVISEITLAVFEDSGWYKVNYYTGGLFRYGKNTIDKLGIIEIESNEVNLSNNLIKK